MFGLLWVAPLLELTAVFQSCREGFYRADPFLAPDCPSFPAVKESGAALPRIGVAYAAFVEPFTVSVLALQVALGRIGYGFGRTQADTLPFQAALNCPRQDAGPFRLELVRKVLVDPLVGNGHRERDAIEPARDGFVDRAEGGHVVARKQELELRKEIEKILAHEARRDFVAAGQFLDARLRPAPTLLGLCGGNQAGAA